LQELCSLSKHLQLTQRQALWSKMQQLGLFDVLTKVIAAGAPCVKLRATDILLSTLGHDPLPLRGFLTRQPGHELLGLLVREMLSAPDDSGLPEQIAELLKVGRGGRPGSRLLDVGRLVSVRQPAGARGS
jgi:protein phosphatase-4 regulatory subunit 3